MHRELKNVLSWLLLSVEYVVKYEMLIHGHPFNRLYTTVTVKCCTLVSPITVALFTGPSLSSEHVTQDPSATRDSERYPGEGLGRESESSDSDTEQTTGERKENNGVVFKVDDWIALSGNQEVVMAC